MSTKFLQKFKPREYAVRVLPGQTSQEAVKVIKRNRILTTFKKVVTAGLAVTALLSGVGVATTGTLATSQQAEANILADMLCINKNDAGRWSAGANRFYHMGGRATNMGDITATTKVTGVASSGTPLSDWSDVPGDSEYVNAYEKYGAFYPKFTAWVPVYSTEELDFTGVSLNAGTYGPDTVPAGKSSKVPANSSGLTSTDILSCTNLFGSISAGTAEMIAAMPRFVVSVALELYGVAMSSSISQEGSPLKPLGDKIDELITGPGGLRDVLFLPFMIPLILIGAIWVAYVGIVKRLATNALQSVLWMVAAIAFGTVFLAKPTLISGFVDDTVSGVNGVITEAVLAPGKATDMCNVEDRDAGKEEVRETKCIIWYATIYAPWVTGQFGVSANGGDSADPNRSGNPILIEDPRGIFQEAKIEYGSKQSVAPKTWPQFMVDRQATTKSFEISEVAYAQLSGASSFGINSTWASASNAIPSAILMNFGASAATLVLFVYGFVLIIYQLTMIMAVLMSPFFFLFGIVPNWGRRVLMRYFEILASLAIKRIITTFMLAVYLLFYTMIVGGPPILIIQIILIGALALFAIFSRNKFINMFTQNINFGGNKSIGLPGAKAAGVAAGVGGAITGGLLGGVAGAALLGLGAKKASDNASKDIAQGKNPRIEGSPVIDSRPPRPGGGGPGGPPDGPPPSGGGGRGGRPPGPPNDPPSGGGAAGAVNTVKKAINTVEDGKKVINTVKKFTEQEGSSPTGGMPGAKPGSAPTGQSVAPKGVNIPKGTPGPVPGPVGVAPVAPVSPGVGAAVAPASTVGSAAGTVGAGAATTAAGAGAASVAPAATAAGAGAATAGATGAATAAAGAGAGAATAGAASGVAAGAAAGSVVPVAGTIVGAAVGGAAAVAAAHRRRTEQQNQQDES